jgi:hypothetical protein
MGWKSHRKNNSHHWKLLVIKCVCGGGGRADLHAYQLARLFAPKISEPLAIHVNAILLSYKSHSISLV